MSSCRPFTREEFPKILDSCSGKYELRDRALIWLGACTGFRIDELLAIRLGDVFEHGKVLEEVSLPARFLKGKRRGRTKKIYPQAQEAIDKWIEQLKSDFNAHRKSYLFSSRKGGPITRQHAWRILNNAASRAGIPTKRIGTHSLRKTFADRMYDYYDDRAREGEKIDPMRMVQLELDHVSIETTYTYMEFRLDKQKPDHLFDEYETQEVFNE